MSKILMIFLVIAFFTIFYPSIIDALPLFPVP